MQVSEGSYSIHLGDSLEVLKSFADNSIDSIVQDPPSFTGFMGLAFDQESEYQNFLPIMQECLRVLKPGGHILVWSLPRTSWMTGYAINAAGFEIRDVISHLFGCASDDTEILTEDGWKTCYQVKIGDPVASVTPEGHLSYSPLKDIRVRPHFGKMAHLTGKSLDQLLTLDHSIWSYPGRSKWKRVEYDHILSKRDTVSFVGYETGVASHNLPVAAKTYDAVPAIGLDLAELLGWVITEGHYHTDVNAVSIYQNAGPNAERIRDLLTRMGIKFSEYSRISNRYRYVKEPATLPTQLQFYISVKDPIINRIRGELLPLKTAPPVWLARLPQDEAMKLFQTLNAGDGSTQKSGTSGAWYQKNPYARDWFQILCCHLGIRTSTDNGKIAVSWCLTNTIHVQKHFKKRWFKLLDYSGNVWCPTTVDGSWVARRNGKVFITGNSGFPKSMSIAKAIQKASGVEPIGELPPSLGMANNPQWNDLKRQLVMPEPEGEAALWEGWGTALKPAREDWILARKPISESTIAKNVQKWGTGAINIDGTRIGKDAGWSYPNGRGGKGSFDSPGLSQNLSEPMEASKGRFPANTVFSHSEDCKVVGVKQVKSGKAVRSRKGGKNIHSDVEKPPMKDLSYGDEAGNETVERWECSEDCAVRIMDSQTAHLKGGTAIEENRTGEWSGNTTYAPRKSMKRANHGYGDSGGASRFFYCAKPSKREKEEGCQDLPKKTAAELTGRKEGSAGLVAKHVDGSDKANPFAGTSGAEPRANTHPTPKSIVLMRYLVRLVTPPNGTCLDAFMGSGTTGLACLEEGVKFVGIERHPEYFEIAKARLAHKFKALS